MRRRTPGPAAGWVERGGWAVSPGRPEQQPGPPALSPPPSGTHVRSCAPFRARRAPGLTEDPAARTWHRGEPRGTGRICAATRTRTPRVSTSLRAPCSTPCARGAESAKGAPGAHTPRGRCRSTPRVSLAHPCPISEDE